MTTSQYFRDSANIFDNEEPLFDSPNVHWSLEYMRSVVPEAKSTWCYKIQRAIVDDKPTSHYCVTYWKNKWGLSKQHLYFIDTTEAFTGLMPEKMFHEYWIWCDSPTIDSRTGIIQLEYHSHGRSEDNEYMPYRHVSLKYRLKLLDYLRENGYKFDIQYPQPRTPIFKRNYHREMVGFITPDKIRVRIDIRHGNWTEENVLVEFILEG